MNFAVAGRFLSRKTTLFGVFVFIAVVPTSFTITTTHHDKPEEAQPIKMATKMRTEGFAIPSFNTSKLETAERQKRLLPYMTFYLEQDFNRPHGHSPPLGPGPAPTSYATTGAIKQPTILQHYHNKFTELTNGISYQPASKFVQVPPQKIKLTPFLDSNALPGPFHPMRGPPIKATYTANKPNYSAIYDKLSQLKLQQQYQLGQSYNRHYPSFHVQVPLPQLQPHSQGNYPNLRKPQFQQQPQQIQQVNYIPISDYAHVSDSSSYQATPAKTIVQTYTASSIDIPSSGNGENNKDNAGNVDNDNEERYEPVKTFNEKVKNYGGIHIQQPHMHPTVPLTNEERQQYLEQKYDGDVKKHVLKPVILVRQKPGASDQKPYLIIQRKPAPQKSPYNIELQIPENIGFRPVKYSHLQSPKYDEDIIVESVTPKYIDIIPKYEVKPTLLSVTPTFGKPYSTKYGEFEQNGGQHYPEPVPQPPQQHITSYQHADGQDDYVDNEDSEVKYQNENYRPSVEVLEYADNPDDVISTKQPVVTYLDKPSGKYVLNTAHSSETIENNQKHEQNNYVKYIPTPKSTYPTTPVFTPTVPPVTPAEYQEGSNSLSLILKKLQDTNALPQTLTPDNIDNSIRTLVKILSSLKKQPKFQKPIVVAEDSGEYAGNNEAGVGLGEVPGTVTQIFPENTPEGGTPGTPGVDYPALANIPQTNFNCKTQRYKGFFGDPDTHCQVWHYCDLNGGQASFLCPNGTIFSQVALTCDWWYNVKCSNTAQLYVLNERLYKYILPLAPKFPEDYSGPLVDRYLALKFQEMEEKMKRERNKNKEHSSDEDATLTSKQTSGEHSSNESIQDDADELKKETRKHQTQSPIIVPDESNESNETTTSAEN